VDKAEYNMVRLITLMFDVVKLTSCNLRGWVSLAMEEDACRDEVGKGWLGIEAASIYLHLPVVYVIRLLRTGRFIYTEILRNRILQAAFINARR
jgi:hypothetical protein